MIVYLYLCISVGVCVCVGEREREREREWGERSIFELNWNVKTKIKR